MEYPCFQNVWLDFNVFLTSKMRSIRMPDNINLWSICQEYPNSNIHLVLKLWFQIQRSNAPMVIKIKMIDYINML